VSYDHELTLIGATSYEEDEWGNQIPVPKETTILCALKSIGRTEFYNAAANGLRPELIFTIHAYEYNNEQAIKFESKNYRVMRTYAVSFEELELTCEKVAADG